MVFHTKLTSFVCYRDVEIILELLVARNTYPKSYSNADQKREVVQTAHAHFWVWQQFSHRVKVARDQAVLRPGPVPRRRRRLSFYKAPFLGWQSGNFVWLRQNTVDKFGNEFIERSTAVKALLQKVIYRILKNGYNTDSSCFCEEKTPESQKWFRFWRFGLVLTRHLGDKYSKKCVTEIKKITYFSGCLGYN